MEPDTERYTDVVAAYATEVGLKILAAIAFWVVGNRVIREALAEAGFPAPMAAQLLLTRAD